MQKPKNEDELLKTLAENVRERRRAMGMTQEQLAEKAGVSTNYLGKLEIAWRTPSLGTLTRIAEALSTDVADLLTRRTEDRKRGWEERVEASLAGLSTKDRDLAVELLVTAAHYLRRQGERTAD